MFLAYPARTCRDLMAHGGTRVNCDSTEEAYTGLLATSFCPFGVFLNVSLFLTVFLEISSSKLEIPRGHFMQR